MNPFACKSIFLHNMCICVTCFCAVISAFVLLCILKTCFAATHTQSSAAFFRSFARVCKSFFGNEGFLAADIAADLSISATCLAAKTESVYLQQILDKDKGSAYFAQLYFSTVCICRHLHTNFKAVLCF